METATIYRVMGVISGLYPRYIGIMEKKVETTITCYIGFRV